MLRKRTRSVQKEVGETARPDSGSEANIVSQIRENSHKSNSFFNVAGLFWGLNPKNASFNDSAQSPKSPLDEIFLRSPGSPSQDVCQKGWNCGKVGLGIADSLVGDDGRSALARERIVLSSDSKNTVFGPKMRPEPPNPDTGNSCLEATVALPENFSFHHTHINTPLLKRSSDVVFEIGGAPLDSDPLGQTRSCSTDAGFMVAHHHHLIGGGPKSSKPFFPTVASKDGFIESLPSSDIELSEDYTCVTIHGSNPKTTHIYGDCILECHSSDELLRDFVRKVEEDMRTSTKAPTSYPGINFLSSCYACKKPLEGSQDIYIYRGEKAFCSVECRLKEILFDEATEDTIKGSVEEACILKQAS